MRGLPASVDLGPLTGAEVTQLCLGPFQFIINFDTDVSVAIESTVIYTRPDGSAKEIARYPPAATELCELLGVRVSGALREGDGGMTLRFSSGAQLRILNLSEDFESFQVRIGSTTHVA